MDVKKEAISALLKIFLENEIVNRNFQFLKMAYDKLGLYNNKRLLEVNKKKPKMTVKLTDGLYENILEIIVDEIENGNDELLEMFMQYYVDRVPNIQENFLKYGNNREKILDIYKKMILSEDISKKIYFMLFHIVNVDDEEFAKNAKNTIDLGDKYGWMGLERKTYIQMLEMLWGMEDLSNNKLFQKYIGKQRQILADYLEVEPNELESTIVFMSACTNGVDKCLNETVQGNQFCWMEESLFKILDKHFISSDCIVDRLEKKHSRIVKDNFENLCAATIYYKYIEFQSRGEKLTLSMVIRQASIENVQAFFMGVISSFYFELLAEELNKVLEEYYKIFSFDKILNVNREKELLDEISELKRQVNRYKERVSEYAESEFAEKQKQYSLVKKEDRSYVERIALLEKQLEEQRRLNERQQQRLQDQEEYISLLGIFDENEQQEEVLDMSVFGEQRIVFVGGMQELIVKLRPIFTHSTFINDEAVVPPSNIDMIVMFPKFMNHVLFYKYIALAREKNIKVIYCNSNNVDMVLGTIGRS